MGWPLRTFAHDPPAPGGAEGEALHRRRLAPAGFAEGWAAGLGVADRAVAREEERVDRPPCPVPRPSEEPAGRVENPLDRLPEVTQVALWPDFR